MQIETPPQLNGPGDRAATNARLGYTDRQYADDYLEGLEWELEALREAAS